MSELEILRRQQYKRNRKKWALTQLVAIVILATIALTSFLIYNRMNRTQYIEYTETGRIDYSVQYKDNEFFPDEWQDKDQSYISSLVQAMTASLVYRLQTSSDEMKFGYEYDVGAKMLIASKEKGTPYYVIEETLVETKSGKKENKDFLEINESVCVDFVKYDSIARSFVDTYGLDSVASCTLIITLNVRTECANNGFSQRNDVLYTTSLNVPLATDSFNVHRTSGSTEGEVKVLEYVGGAHKELFLTISTATAILTGLMTLVLLAFLHLTKNEDITYAAKVRRILRAYGSFIQRIDGEFDCEGYQLVSIKSFVEMLGIRDTIQSPVLMSENRDETMTRFYIPTPTKILYLFEIKVDNYDDIYGTEPDADYPFEDDGYGAGSDDTPVEPTPTLDGAEAVSAETDALEAPAEETPVEEAPVEEAPVEEAPVEEAPAEEAPAEEETTEAHATADDLLDRITLLDSEDLGEDGDDDILAYIDEEGNIVRITCSRSFTANLIQATPRVRDYYNAIKNHILSYKGVKARMSWRTESYRKGRVQLFKMKIRGKTICLYCALDPAEYSETKYFHETATAKVYANVPMMVRIKSDRGLKRAKELVDDVMTRFVILPDPKATEMDHVSDYPFDSTKNLVRRGLIKLLLPDAVLSEPKHEPAPTPAPAPTPEPEKEIKVEVVKEDVVEEIVLFDATEVDATVIDEIAAEPTPELEEIDYDDASEEIVEFVETEEKPGVDVIGVVWPERPKRNKIYRYDPNGEEVSVGDVVIVPTHDAASKKDVIRKAAVAHSNHKVPLEDLKHPLKKIAGVIRKKMLETPAPAEADTSAKAPRGRKNK